MYARECGCAVGRIRVGFFGGSGAGRDATVRVMRGKAPLAGPGPAKILRAAVCAAAALTGLVAGPADWAQGGGDTYFEFGTVVAMGKHDVDLQTFDPQRQRLVQRSYALGKGTQADTVHVGDKVEVIYQAGAPGAEWVLTRLLVLHGEVPKAGPADNGLAVDVAPRAGAGAARPAGNAAASAAPDFAPAAPSAPSAPLPDTARTAAAPATAANTAPPAVVPARKPVNTGRGGKNTAAVPARAPASATALNKAPANAKGAGTTQPVALGGTAGKAIPGVISIPLGVGGTTAAPRAPGLKGVTQEAPGQECGREADWPSLPISMAVLDFRYPTENEEANDVSKTGGGSGTAIADLVYNQLSAEQPEFQMRRGDREKLFRMDFAGAARLGRQLGVDSVLLGTFAPVEVASPDPAFPNPVKAYTLRAGVVETCTGQLLYRLTSITCPAAPGGGPPPVKGTLPPSCPGSEISVKDTVNPLESAEAYKQPIDMLLGPLLHNGTPAGVIGSAGVVTAVNGNNVTIRVGPQGAHNGVPVSIHAFRLAKNPSTNTLQRFEDTEIGRLMVQRVNGSTATGTYSGDVAPKPGDTAEVITE